MAKVVSLYLLFSGLGIVLVSAGYRLHVQHVVAPLRPLVEATQELAVGNPDRTT